MKARLTIFLICVISSLFSEVIFWDDFERPAGPVGNDWLNVGSDVNATIVDGAMRVEAGANRGISHQFAEIDNGIYYIQYDWKFASGDGYVLAFPSHIPILLFWENTGFLYTDAYGVLINPQNIGHVALNTWANIKWKIDLDNNLYSLWLNNDLVIENANSNPITLFNSFTFRTANATNGSQFIDNFVVFDTAPPSIPQAFQTIPSVESISLEWETLVNNDLITYEIYRSETSPALDLLVSLAGNVNHFTDNTAQANQDYFYRIKTLLANTVESDFSPEIRSHLLPKPVLYPDSLSINFNQNNPQQAITFTLENTGAYPLYYNLSGTDDLAPENQIIDIADFTPMGIHQGHTYYLSDNPMTWYEAKALCESKGGHLVTISDSAENTFIYNNTTDKAWLGFTDEEEEDVWQWITGEEVTFTNWLPGEPNNNGNDEDFAHIRHNAPFDQWNDTKNDSSENPYAILEFDYLFPASVLLIEDNTGVVQTNNSLDFIVNINSSNLDDGSYDTAIKLASESLAQALYYPVTLNVDFNPPLQVENLRVNPSSTNADQIGIEWDFNLESDQVEVYNVYRKGRYENDWSLMASLPNNQNFYIDNNFTPLDTTYVHYSIVAEDWVENLSQMSEPVIASLERYLAPDNLQITNLDDRDIKLTWTPVSQTIAGISGTPSCYIIYKSQYPTPLSDFDFLAISVDPEFTHNWALYFQPADRLYYIVTAYGGNINRLNSLLTQKNKWTKKELEDRLANK